MRKSHLGALGLGRNGVGVEEDGGKDKREEWGGSERAGKWKNEGKWKISYGKYSNDAITSLSLHDRQSYIPIKAF